MGYNRHHDPGDLGDHPSAAPAGRHPVDDELRAAGFTIHSRPEKGEPVWRDPKGALHAEGVALAMVRRAILLALEDA